MAKKSKKSSSNKKGKKHDKDEDSGVLEGKALKNEFTKRGVPSSDLGGKGKKAGPEIKRKGKGEAEPFEKFLGSITDPASFSLKEKVNLADNELRECLEKFTSQDPDSKGWIAIFDFKKSLKECNSDKTENQIVQAFRALDIDSDGRVELKEWLKAFKRWILKEVRREEDLEKQEMKKTFDALDEDEDGFLTINDFTKISQYVTESEKIKPSDAETEASLLYKEIAGKNEKLDLERFIKAYHKLNESKGKKKKKKKKKK